VQGCTKEIGGASKQVSTKIESAELNHSWVWGHPGKGSQFNVTSVPGSRKQASLRVKNGLQAPENSLNIADGVAASISEGTNLLIGGYCNLANIGMIYIQ